MRLRVIGVLSARPHAEMSERIGEIDPEVTTVLFCNGPLCSATPEAIRTLLDADHPAGGLRYYRGGIHDG